MKKHILIPMGMIVAVIVATAGCGPIGPTPGLVIGGEEQPPPADFEFVREHDLILIRTYFGGWLPQVHNIWGVGVTDGIYSTAIPGARWRARLNDDPNVLVRVGDNTYELTAARVTDPEVIQRVFDAYQEKYGPQLEEILGRPGTIDDMNDLIGFTAR